MNLTDFMNFVYEFDEFTSLTLECFTYLFFPASHQNFTK